MSRIDRVVLLRLSGSVLVTGLLILSIAVLVESVNIGRFNRLSETVGVAGAVGANVAIALRFVFQVFSIIVLVGAIGGLLSLQGSREMTIIKAAGLSVWSLMRAPILAALATGIVISLAAEPGTVLFQRAISPAGLEGSSPSQRTAPLWVDDRTAEGRPYVLEAREARPTGEIGAVTVFMLDGARERIEAQSGRLEGGAWILETVRRLTSTTPPESLPTLTLETSRARGDLQAEIGALSNLTLYEVIGTIRARITNPRLRTEVDVRLLRLIALPLNLVGALFIAFAFTAGYRRTNNYGLTVLYGIVIGFVVYALTEIFGRAGAAGVIDPVFAALGPSLLSFVIGLTVLLYKEDGRA